MNFQDWIILEDMKQLAKAYSSLLKDVPQNPKTHPEGNVLTHIKLVRKAIPKAIVELQNLKKEEPFSSIFSKIDFTLSPEEMDILIIASWLHDIGKASATAVDPDTGELTARRHQYPEHYLPHIQKLLNVAPDDTKKLYLDNIDIIHFLIERHMDFSTSGGFSNSFIKKYYENGVLKNIKEIKLLLILMWADKMGRTPEMIVKSLNKNKEKLLSSTDRAIEQYKKATKQQKSSSFEGTPEEMVNMLKEKGLGTSLIRNSLASKFPNLSSEEIYKLLGEL